MTVVCPNCKTVYHLSEDKAKPGAKLRCTVCKHVFAMQSSDPDNSFEESIPLGRSPETGHFSINIGDEPAKQKKKSSPFIFVLLLLIAFAATGAVLWKTTTVLDSYKPAILKRLAVLDLDKSAIFKMLPDKLNFFGEQESGTDQGVPLKDLIERLDITNLRQYMLQNEKIGNILVIEGKVANGYDEPREFIVVEASIYDSANNLLVSKDQMGGAVVSLFQLQVLGEQELEQTLNNKLDILTNNTNIPPGGTVPFMLVFYKPPESATDFVVKVIGAKRPDPKTN